MVNAQESVIAYLRRLKPSGPEGFEGLIAQLLERLTGQRFFLAHSGTQDGLDMSTGAFSGTEIAVESKRFRSQKSFNRSDLLGELVEAAWNSSLDLWVLASTKRVPHQILTALQKEGRTRGIEVEVLDEAPMGNFGDLAVLCAAHEEVVSNFPGFSAAATELRAAFDAIRQHPDFALTLERLLERFHSASVGYAQARETSHSYLCLAFADAQRARTDLGQRIDVLANAGRHVIQRRQAHDVLDSWWTSWPVSLKPMVLLGEEGMGKTWALASWLAGRLNARDAAWPLTLFVPSWKVHSTDILELVSSALTTCTMVRDPQFWSRRAKAWTDRPRGRGPALVLILDGLNERPFFDWRSLLHSMLASPWKNQIATVMTCRPAYWREHLDSDFKASFQQLEVGPYDDQELASALSTAGLQVTDLPSSLDPLLRLPRYLDLTIRFQEKLEQSGDVTTDRLLYEDWRDRISRKRGLFSDEDFRALLAQLARGPHESFSKREVQDLLPQGERFLTGLDEIITGGILVRDPLGKYRVSPDRLVQGMGLLLASEVQNARGPDKAGMQEALASFLEPHSDMDRKVAICRSAVTFAVFDRDYPETARLLLIEQWIESRNLAQVDFDSCAAYLPASVGSYLRLIEHFWLTRQFHHEARSLLVWAFFRWRDNSQVRQAVAVACERWLSFVHRYGFRYMRGQDDASRESLRREIEERAGRPLQVGKKLLLADELEVVDDDNLLRLAELGLLLASLFPVVAFIPALRRWALSKSVMGVPDDREEVAWILRRNGTDIWPALGSCITPLLDGTHVEQQAAARLLWACGQEVAAELSARRLPKDLFRQSYFDETYTKDPCQPFWRKEDCDHCASRSDIPDRLVALKLAPHALDPNFRMNFDPKSRIEAAVTALCADPIRSQRRQMTRYDIDLEQMEPALAVFAENSLAEIYRNIVLDIPGQTDSESALSQLSSCHLILDQKKDQELLRDLWEASCRVEPFNDDAKLAELKLFAGVLFHVSARTQFSLLLRRPEEAWDTPSLGPYIKRMSIGDLRQLAAGLLDSPLRELERKLWFLWYQPFEAVVEIVGAGQVVGLLRHDAPSIRKITADLIFWHGSPQVWDLAIREGCITTSDCQSLRRYWSGSLGTLRYQSGLPYDLLSRGVDFGSLSYMILARPQDLDAYISDLDGAIHNGDKYLNRLDNMFNSGFSEEALAASLQRNPEVVVEWVQMAVGNGSDYIISNFRMMFEALCEPMLKINPGLGEKLFRTLLAKRSRGRTVDNPTGTDVLTITLFRAHQSVHVRELIDEWLKQCTTDKALFDFALAAAASKRSERLADLVRRVLGSSIPIEVATGLTLAGFSIYSSGPAELIGSIQLHSKGWLHEVRRLALYHLERDRWAQEWFRQFVVRSDGKGSFAAFRLFLRCVDRRYWVWKESVIDGTRLSEGKRRYLSVNRESIGQAIKKKTRRTSKRDS